MKWYMKGGPGSGDVEGHQFHGNQSGRMVSCRDNPSEWLMSLPDSLANNTRVSARTEVIDRPKWYSPDIRKGGAGSGDRQGHEFRGNQWTNRAAAAAQEAKLRGEITETKPSWSGGVVAGKMVATLADGSRANFKPREGWDSTTYRRDIKPGKGPEREAAAWEVAKIVGLTDLVAPVIVTSVPGFPHVMNVKDLVESFGGTVVFDTSNSQDPHFEAERDLTEVKISFSSDADLDHFVSEMKSTTGVTTIQALPGTTAYLSFNPSPTPEGSLHLWAEGRAASGLYEDEQFGTDMKDLARAALFDFVIGNEDRHPGNWVVDVDGDKRIKLIDHGLSFGESDRPFNCNLRLMQEFSRRASAQHYPEPKTNKTLQETFAKQSAVFLKKSDAILKKLSDMGLPKSSVDAVARRIQKLKGLDINKLMWWE